jgi:hypothetical protein
MAMAVCMWTYCENSVDCGYILAVFKGLTDGFDADNKEKRTDNRDS